MVAGPETIVKLTGKPDEAVAFKLKAGSPRFLAMSEGEVNCLIYFVYNGIDVGR